MSSSTFSSDIRRLLVRISTFVFLSVFLTGLLIGSTNRAIEKGEYFTLPPSIGTLVFGHSHTECAYDDAQLPGVLNLAQSGESYFYIFFKLRKLIEENPEVRLVVIEFSNNQIAPSMENWVWDAKHVSHRFHKYFPFMNWSDIKILLNHSPKSVLSGLSRNLRGNLAYLTVQEGPIYKAQSWGAFLPLDRVMDPDDYEQKKEARESPAPEKVAETNLEYLDKCVEVCRARGVEVYLLRTPVSRYYPMTNEVLFQAVREERYKSVPFIDLAELSLDETDFADWEHLNRQGAEKTTNALKDRLISSASPSTNP